MDVSSVCDVLISDSIDGPCDLKQCWNSTEDTLVEKLGNTLTGILHVHDVQLQLSGCISLSVGDKLCEEFTVDQSKLLNPTTQENPNKLAESRSIEKEPSNLVSVHDKDEVSDLSLDAERHAYSDNLVCEHLMSLSAPKKLLSAMKGNREKLGITLKKLTVSWAPDVYDPPVTFRPHIVKSHSQQRSRSKKNSKHMHKGKSSQGSNNGKRCQRHVGKSDRRSKSFASSISTLERSPFGAYNHSTLELMDFTIADYKCGSSFLRTSLANGHIPVAEAT